MKYAVSVFIAFFIGLGTLAAQGLSLDSPIDFSIDLHRLYQAARNNNEKDIPQNRLLLIEGTIGSRDTIIDEEDDFLAELELVGGHWESEEEIVLYRAIVIFDGPEYHPLFNPRGQDRLRNGDKIIVVAEFLGLDDDDFGEGRVPLLLCLAWRKVF